MKQEKITPERFEVPIRKEFPHHTDLWIKEMAKKYYQLHLQSLQQLLDEASEELPDDKKIDSEMMAYPDKSSMWAFKEGMNSMRSEAAKTVVKLKAEVDELEVDLIIKDNTIQQLKEELGRLKNCLFLCQALGCENENTNGLYCSEHAHLDSNIGSPKDR